MSDYKSIQRLIAVQAIYETTLNKRRQNDSTEEIFHDIISSSEFKKKLEGSNLSLSKEIYKGVLINLDSIDNILSKSMDNNNKLKSMNKLLISIFRSAIYEILFSNNVKKKILISEYLLIANRFFGNNETALINGVLDNLQNSQT